MSKKVRKLNMILVIVMLVFIWGQSMIPADISSAESEFFLGFMEKFMDVGTGYMRGGQVYDLLMGLAGKVDNWQLREFLCRCINYLQVNYFSRDANFWIRKLAHFSEYMILGFLLCSLLAHRNGHGRFFLPWLLCMGVSGVDESIQLLTPGRWGRLRDVVLDMMGATTGLVICMLFLAFLVHRERRKKKRQTSPGKTP